MKEKVASMSFYSKGTGHTGGLKSAHLHHVTPARANQGATSFCVTHRELPVP
jgi:hypothetical protein